MKNLHKQASQKRQLLTIHMRQRIREGLFLISMACAIFLLISLSTYHQSDPGWSNTGFQKSVQNWGGRVGAWMADASLSLFGLTAYLFPFLLIFSSWLGLSFNESNKILRMHEWVFKLLGWFFTIVSVCALASFYWQSSVELPTAAGGIIGDVLDCSLTFLFNKTGSTLLFMTTLLCGVTFVTGFSWVNLIKLSGKSLRRIFATLIKKKNLLGKSLIKSEPLIEKSIRTYPDINSEERKYHNEIPKKPALIVNKEIITSSKKEELKFRKPAVSHSEIQLTKGSLPPLNLLNPPLGSPGKAFKNISLEDLSMQVELHLADFGVQAKVVAVHPGPVVTRFEIDLAPGIKVSKITGLAKDIARSLSTVSVRVVEVIPGKSVIGLEIPNENRELVTLHDMLESSRYVQARSPVTLVLGKDISGNPVVVDLTKMPHLLVAGTTGSGKSVGLNAMLLSMLFKSTPEQLRLILIDPKMLELSVYDGIPHLLAPVITDMKDAANALRWCVAEMDRRYRLMASLGVRNLLGYNQKVLDAIKQGQPLGMPASLVTDEASAKAQLEPLPIIVVIADELADMMMVVGKKVEDLIARIAQKARAAGIHLILATQRPSVDVITGLIKANIPTRIAFQVSSRIDSRTILDQQGAENLLGHGDMLYLPPGAGVPIRVHGAYVADEEVHRVVAAWRTAGDPVYLTEITDENRDAQGAENENNAERDPLYDDAVRVVTESRRASISLVQRRLRIGYNRAARMIEEMEKAGIVSIADTSGTREVLIAGTVD